MTAHAEAPPHLAHHFETSQQQFESGKLGMWLFLATEILMFGGLFCAYAIYRGSHPEIFLYAHQFLDVKWGGINTIVLICSSFTMAWGVRAAQLGQRGLLILMLFLTLACACGFMAIKFVEYKHKFHSGLLWGTNYAPQEHHGDAAETGPGSHATETLPGSASPSIDWDYVAPEASIVPLAATGPSGLATVDPAADGHAPSAAPENVHIFFGIYFAMTGLHGIHVLAGMVVISFLIVGAFQGRFGPDYFTPIDLFGLYWHIVDLIWIFLFPLLYLIH